MTEVQQTEKVTPRLKTKYRDEIRGALQEQFQYGNVMQVPGLVKVVVNMGVGEAAKDSKIIDGAVTDFRGLSDRQFDGNGNYTFGLSEQTVFHEIDQDKIDRVRGMDITVVTTAKNDDEGRALLKALGFPFKTDQ